MCSVVSNLNVTINSYIRCVFELYKDDFENYLLRVISCGKIMRFSNCVDCVHVLNSFSE